MIPAASYSGKRVAVFGLGRSGIAAAQSLAAGAAEVRAWDDDSARRDAATEAGVPVRDLYVANWSTFSALVLAPGIPLDHPAPHEVVQLARAGGCEVTGDIEVFARQRLPARVAAVTGTNGKSTTTALAAHVLRACGRDAVEGGNFGAPALGLRPLGVEGVYVLELSSYQIERTRSLAADVAVLLNLSPDHLDRHGGMSGYVAAKKRLFDGQRTDQIAVVGVDDADSRGLFDRLVGEGRQVVPISGTRAVDRGIYVDRGILHDSINGAARAVADLNGGALMGEHNWQNAAAAFAVATTLGCASEPAAAAIRAFPGLKHRMEAVVEIDGIRFVNDSKATNTNAAGRALATYDNVYWIAGGRPKEQGIDGLAHLFGKLRAAFLIGEATVAFATTLKGRVPVTHCETLDRAVADAFAAARAGAEPGAVVLLSPACASFDQFRDFEHRGESFRALAEALQDRAG
jgi:UDP-N-acetylmuramoylalanine--D-glutamate ligase